MITEENFTKVLERLKFEQDHISGRWYKKYGNTEMAVDFKDRKLIYPKAQGLIVHDGTTSNFSHNENFVVFECVCRLLEKGYRAEHIELEPRWKLGREQKSGKADILIKDPEGADLIIVECKTAGDEYREEKRNTETDGGQLFSYLQQNTSTRWLMLYASDWRNGDIVLESHVIKVSDDNNILESAEADESILTYSKAHSVPERFKVWEETYGKKWFDNLIFDPESKAYAVGIPPLRKRKLKEFSPDDKIVNGFEEILRHNNVSDKENAFNRLLALFICKLVDEIKKDENDEVDFQYKQGTDTYETLQDRLQQLHRQGMEEFMREKITYVESDYAEKLFERYKGKARKKAIEDLNETIKKLKFYSNNDFAFKEVHNKELFLQNGKVLVEVIQLFEQYKIVYPKKQQLLGDLFEQLLNKGFKQNEGQFFTPIPITRFIWDSLPLKKYCDDLEDLPKVIDYACGAGHFLTEAIEAINSVANNPDNSWTERKIFGLEKDYRLARVSKVSMFMNGAGSANIIFGDGLENYPDKQIKPHSFDILVANPPYAVSGFKQHLNLKNNSFQLLEKELITDNGNEIETLFVERIAQLLKPKGIAALILPVALLSNNSRSYIATREQLLQNFYLRAFVSLGSNTFSATGTNTVILFLERHDEPPCRAKLMEDCRDEIMRGTASSNDWSDLEVLNDYLDHQNIDHEEFRRFVSKGMKIQDVKEHPYFKIYAEEFNWEGVKHHKNATPEDREKKETEEFYKFALGVEKEKIYYFALVREQQPLVITAPSENRAQQDFLGYKWSNRRGKEGLRVTSPGGKLYDNEDRFAPGTLACAVRDSFSGKDPLSSLNQDLQEYAKTYSLKDMLDFSGYEFNKEISTSARQATRIVQSKYPTLKLSEVQVGLNKRDITKTTQYGIHKKREEGDTPVVTQSRDERVSGYFKTDRPITDLPLILFGDHTCVFKYIDFKFVMGPNGTLIKANKDKINPKFLYFYLSSIQIENEGKYESHLKYIKDTLIPVPTRDLQERVVSACEPIEKEFNNSRMLIETYRQKIVDVFMRLGVIDGWLDANEKS